MEGKLIRNKCIHVIALLEKISIWAQMHKFFATILLFPRKKISNIQSN